MSYSWSLLSGLAVRPAPTQGSGSVGLPGQRERPSVLAVGFLAFTAHFYGVSPRS